MPPLHGKMVVSRGAGSNHGLPLPPDELIASHPQALGLLNGPGAVCVVVGGLGGRSNRLHRPPRSRAQIRSSINAKVQNCLQLQARLIQCQSPRVDHARARWSW